MIQKVPAKEIYHDFTWGRAKHMWFWAGQIVCRLFGHRVPNDISRAKCGRCGIALEEIYGLNFYNYYDPNIKVKNK